MEIASAHCKICWKSQNINAKFRSKQQRVLRKPDVIANTDSKGSILSFENSKLSGPFFTEPRFKESYSARYVYIKQVLLSVLSCDLASFIKAQARVKYLAVFASSHLWYAAAYNIRTCLYSQLA